MDKAMSTPEHMELRAQTTIGLVGDVLELGFGSGLNVEHYPDDVSRVWVAEPSKVGMSLAAERIAASDVHIEITSLDGAKLPLADDSIDSALSSWTLCTIPDLQQALAEVRRVLRPGGAFHFVEHGLSHEPTVAKWQNRMNWAQRIYAGGCNLNRPIRADLIEAGFEIESMENFYMDSGFKSQSYMYQGIARNPR
jgi:ubiquinone/menaquinone biosynthesis C-methylase UbiE